jgi:phosphoglycerate kinase
MAPGTNGEVRYFRDAEVKRGEKWIFSADFNVKDVVNIHNNPQRIDEELEDILKISDSGGIAVILAHEGRYGKARHLAHITDYIAQKLNKRVHYFPENSTDLAVEFIDELKPGEITLMGNTRFNKREETNDSYLADTFAAMGDYAVIGGFGKAHRKHASNYGILDYRKGYLSTSQEQQMQKLQRWSGKSDDYSVAVIGGMKKEKITEGLLGFAEIYDHIIPGGIVLNTILKLKNVDIGLSKIDDDGETFEKEVEKALEKYSDKILIPKEVIASSRTDKGFEYAGRINFNEFGSVPEGCLISSYVMSFDAQCALARVIQKNGRLVVAGTPDIPNLRDSIASHQLQSWLPQIGKNALILGGDTVHDIDAKDAVVSTGGGSALMYLTKGTTHVYEKLKENFSKRP